MSKALNRITKVCQKLGWEILEWKDSQHPVKLKCQRGHKFERRPSNIKPWTVCPACNNFKTGRAKSNDEFIKECKTVHGDIYLYDKVDYVSAWEHVTIICRTHGDFEQYATLHRKGSGCPKYTSRRYN